MIKTDLKGKISIKRRYHQSRNHLCLMWVCKKELFKKPRGRHLSRPCQPFRGPLPAILDFAGGAGLQAVSKCPLHRQAGILGHLQFWGYFTLQSFLKNKGQFGCYLYFSVCLSKYKVSGVPNVAPKSFVHLMSRQSLSQVEHLT